MSELDKLVEHIEVAQQALQWADKRIQELEALTKWQPIETAPMDGTRIDAWGWSQQRFTNVWWEATKHDWLFWGFDGFGMGCIRLEEPLTHWMPRPSPPAD